MVVSSDPNVVAANKVNFDNYVSDFCSTYASVLPQRTNFVKALKEIVD